MRLYYRKNYGLSNSYVLCVFTLTFSSVFANTVDDGQLTFQQFSNSSNQKDDFVVFYPNDSEVVDGTDGRKGNFKREIHFEREIKQLGPVQEVVGVKIERDVPDKVIINDGQNVSITLYNIRQFERLSKELESNYGNIDCKGGGCYLEQLMKLRSILQIRLPDSTNELNPDCTDEPCLIGETSRLLLYLMGIDGVRDRNDSLRYVLKALKLFKELVRATIDAPNGEPQCDKNQWSCILRMSRARARKSGGDSCDTCNEQYTCNQCMQERGCKWCHDVHSCKNCEATNATNESVGCKCVNEQCEKCRKYSSCSHCQKKFGCPCPECDTCLQVSDCVTCRNKYGCDCQAPVEPKCKKCFDVNRSEVSDQCLVSVAYRCTTFLRRRSCVCVMGVDVSS